MSLVHYLKIWLASVRYSIVRTMMFRMDFIMWSLVELFWMGVNILLINVIYAHTDSIAGWSKYEMLLLVGTAMILQRLMMGFFWSNLFELGRNIRTGQFDFFLAQPGNPLFMLSTRKIDLDSIMNCVVALSVVVFAVTKLGLHPSLADIGFYVLLLGCALLIHYAAVLLIVSLTFWLIGSQGIEGSYFTLFEFARIPRQAFVGAREVIFVWILPAVISSNVPASALIHGFQPISVLWLGATAAVWLAIAMLVFRAGLRRYASASS
ncbi:MAG: ABC-2 family transporter protein [Candidatus Didemnitutus sp.]|nr:ABC-2 family transporter protein [Candidatus Didemnitutus sp.]